MEGPGSPLLGRLAMRWFNEVIITDALRLLLEDPALMTAFKDLLGSKAGVDLAELRSLEREHVTNDGRIDLMGVDQQGRPLVIVEAKFGHTMTDEQMLRYLDFQSTALGGDAEGVLVLLAPTSRMAEAEAVAAHVRANHQPSSGSPARVETVALSWEELLDSLAAVTADERTGVTTSCDDVTQLRAVCEQLGGQVAPLESKADAERIAVLAILIDKVTPALTGDGWTGPVQVRDANYDRFRYFALTGWEAACSLGISTRLESEYGTPIWLRFHKDTPEFDEVEKTLRRHPALWNRTLSHDRHRWIPIPIDESRGIPDLIPQVLNEVLGVLTHLRRPGPLD